MFDSIEPPGYYDPPREEPMCPRCEGKRAAASMRAAIDEVFAEYGVPGLIEAYGVVELIESRVYSAVKAEGGMLCEMCYPNDSHEPGDDD